MNTVSIIGRLTKDPEMKTLNGGTTVCRLSLAYNRKYRTNGESKEEVSFFDCVAWGKTGETIAQYCRKGQRIGISGRLSQRSWESSEGRKQSVVEIVVEDFTFIERAE